MKKVAKKTKKKVTKKNFQKLLLQSARQALEYTRGERKIAGRLVSLIEGSKK